MSSEFPSQGLTFWPVNNGDSTTVIVDEATYLQVDLNHLEASEGNDEPTWPVIDQLVAGLPTRDGKPHLAAFALSHPDQDHCRGFETLLEQVEIGELWFTPRVFLEYKKDLCDDAVAFRDEAERRIKATLQAGGDPGQGNRVRLFGSPDLLEKDGYQRFPTDLLVIPGNAFTTINRVDHTGVFRGFVHAPFKDDLDGDRNDTSLSLQLTLYNGDQQLRALLFGDLSYPVLKKIFERSAHEDLAWNILLSPHHCSKSAMYWKNPDENEETLKRDILDAMSSATKSPSYVIASSRPIPASDEPGADPPHARAKRWYQKVTETFACTMDPQESGDPKPIIFELRATGIEFLGAVSAGATARDFASIARGGDAPPSGATTYGCSPF